MPRGEGGISEALLGPNVKRLPYSFLFKMSVSGEKSTDRRDRQDRTEKLKALVESRALKNYSLKGQLQLFF